MITTTKILVLSGGVGGARFLEGLLQIKPQKDISVIVNTGDDDEFYGLHVSPDVDIVLYTLAGKVNKKQGWGFTNDTYHTMNQLITYGNTSWFKLGDKDLATHIHRTNRLKQGKLLNEVVDEMCKNFGLKLNIRPMSNQRVRTKIKTPQGILSFQEYFVKYQTREEILDIVFPDIEKAKPAPGVLESIKNATTIILAPSNPLVSIGPILAIPGIRHALQKTNAKIIAISPIIAGKTIKGPADKMLKAMGVESSPKGIAELYRDFLDVMILDIKDQTLQKDIEKLGIKTIITNTIMKNIQIKKQLALTALQTLV